MFTSTAQSATHVFLLTRTNFEVPKHAGLTTFLVPLDGPGVEIQPMLTVGGQRTNATFYSDVRVPDSARVGDPERGWDVMGVALVYERGGGGSGRTGPTLTERVAEWCQTHRRPDGSRVFDDPTVQERLARIAIESEVARLLGQRVAWVSSTGGMPGVEGSMAKLYGSEAHQRHYSTLQDILGAEAVLTHQAAEAPLQGDVDSAFRYAIVGTIYGGTSEIQREIVAQRRLGLPRNRPKS
jgi:alkylation response protein AidB-like acyl-CoA dehydrogenase